MAYDANDPADKKIVDDAVAAALQEAETNHEAEIEGLKNKNKQLLDKISKLRAGNDNGDNNAEIDRLERELDESKGKLRTTETELRETKRKLTTVEGERDTATKGLETETSFSRNLLIENDLTTALTAANVAPHLMDGAKALLAGKAKVVTEGDDRKAVVGDKPLSEFVKEWALGDQGKAYIAAPANGGGGGTGGGQGGGAKKISEMTLQERNAHYTAVGQAAFDAQVEAENKASS